ncbi:peptidase U32 family protein [Vallitalea okinawensis]|uniref:peptidase U32 family protein n=1 Tax=Vallitalea okinawensis TaxID=2078660 RepID=UPI000CFB1C2E|nr:U32 family peptidase [Vallitalea okinawensis]
MKNRIELLAPAGSLEALKVAVAYGADAVYCGGMRFGLRAKARNFTEEQLIEGIEYAHKYGKRVFITVNMIPHNEDLIGLEEYLLKLEEVGADAIIVADPGVFATAKAVVPKMEIHLSTQANNTNYKTFNFWHEQGVKRVVAARELSFDEIKEISEKTPDTLDIEAFVHGAMCISYSGRCLLSNVMTAKDANKGACTHPCRWRYHLVEEKRPGEYFPIIEDDHGTYIYNSKDLCMIMYIPELIDSGIYSFKIEGRMKTPFYVATVTRTYREAIDDYLKDPSLYESKKDYYMSELQKCSYRDYTTGFFHRKPGHEEQIYDRNTYIRNYNFTAMVLDYDKETKMATIQQRNKFSVGDTIEIMPKKGSIITMKVDNLWDEEGNEVESAPHPKQILRLKIEEEVEVLDIIRCINKDNNATIH